MKVENRKSVTAPLKAFLYGAEEYSFIEVTEWTNGEGWDIRIDDKEFSLHMNELDAINYLTKHLEVSDKLKEDYEV